MLYSTCIKEVVVLGSVSLEIHNVVEYLSCSSCLIILKARLKEQWLLYKGHNYAE